MTDGPPVIVFWGLTLLILIAVACAVVILVSHHA